jgi:hypothetical protein
LEAREAAEQREVEAAARAARWRNLDVRLGLSCPALRPLCIVGWSAVLQAAKDAERWRQRELEVRLVTVRRDYLAASQKLRREQERAAAWAASRPDFVVLLCRRD